jgi:hypothetical protein
MAVRFVIKMISRVNGLNTTITAETEGRVVIRTIPLCNGGAPDMEINWNRDA